MFRTFTPSVQLYKCELHFQDKGCTYSLYQHGCKAVLFRG
uniref:Uncharacterized protein n=1 Tax=Arundo donax TaxID=35708 RepID=A0A0A9GJC1_ARUDO